MTAPATRNTRNFRVLSAALLAASLAACEPFDDTRTTPERESLGREIFGMLCDRVGAQALREDVNGASFHSVCHADESGRYADTVDLSVLAPLRDDARDTQGQLVPRSVLEENRRRRIARIEALARHRENLVRAFNATVPDEGLSIQTPDCKVLPNGKLREELAETLGRLTELYRDDTIPDMTRATADLLRTAAADKTVLDTLSRVDAREGYQPSEHAFALMRSLLAYKRLGPMLGQVGALLGEGGEADQALQTLLAELGKELSGLEAGELKQPLQWNDDGTGALVLSRPRTVQELLSSLLLVDDDAFGGDLPSSFIVRRDGRGMAQVPLDASGRVQPPFVDATGPIGDGGPDGLPDVDANGRFVLRDGVAALPTPFLTLTSTALSDPRDAQGRALNPAASNALMYDYLDVTRTYLSAAYRQLGRLFAPAAAGTEARPNPLLDLAAGLPVLTQNNRADPSLADSVHALGQVIALPETDEALALVSQLASQRPAELARLVAAVTETQRILERHPEAKLRLDTTVADDLVEVFGRAAQKPGLLEDLTIAMGTPETLRLRTALADLMTYRDVLTYDRNNLNGLPFNLTTGQVGPPRTPVDRSLPDTGTNRSEFQRVIQTLHEVKGLSLCTKPGAVAHIKWNFVDMDFPSGAAQATCLATAFTTVPDPMPMCGILRIRDVSALILDVVLDRSQLEIQDPCLRSLIANPLSGIVGGADAFLEEVSGIKGFSTRPTLNGVSRLVSFDTPRPGYAGDTRNAQTGRFLADIIDATPSTYCRSTPFRDTDGVLLNLRTCDRREDTLPYRLGNSTFPLELNGFVQNSRPMAAAFADHGGSADFVELVDTLHRHWGTAGQNSDECDPNAPQNDPRWCSQSGIVTFEPMLAEILRSDLLPAIGALTPHLRTLTVPHCEASDAAGRCTRVTQRNGVTVLAELTRMLVDPNRNNGLTNRHGDRLAHRGDGSTRPQTTPAQLLVEASRGFQKAFETWQAEHPEDTDRARLWASSALEVVTVLLPVEGAGANARFREPAMVQRFLPHAVSILRAQRRAHCPDLRLRCDWARGELVDDLIEGVESSAFPAMARVLDALRRNPSARAEVEAFLGYLFSAEGGGVSPRALTAAASVDLVQLLADEDTRQKLAPLITKALDRADVKRPGLVASGIDVFRGVYALPQGAAKQCAVGVDPNGALSSVLSKLVTPMGQSQGTPLDLMLDAVTEVNRVDPKRDGVSPLSNDDYQQLANELDLFLTDEGSGLEQLYALLKEATGK